MRQYLSLLEDILENGEIREDRTGTGTKSVFGRQLRFNLEKGFPLVTTKKMGLKSVYSELLWFLEGSTDERRLAEIQHGSRDVENKTIWTENALADYWVKQAKFVGDLGKIYGNQWRSWTGFDNISKIGYNGGDLKVPVVMADVNYVDQIKDVIKSLKENPWGRRHLVIAYNPAEVSQMCLPPCHMFAQFWVSSNRKLSCQFYMRSGDAFLGIPYNIASYALLTHMIAQVCDFEVGELVMSLGDAHIYLNHIEQVNEQLTREPYPLPKLWIDTTVKDIDGFTLDSIKLIDYQSHNRIIASMAV
jgi:thymidylate synthase